MRILDYPRRSGLALKKLLYCKWFHRKFICFPEVWDRGLKGPWHCGKCHPCSEGIMEILVNKKPLTKIHKLKTWPVFYKYVASGEKTFELRSEDDRNFKVGDILILREYTNGAYTGRECKRRVTFIMTMYPLISGNYVGMSIEPIEEYCKYK